MANHFKIGMANPVVDSGFWASKKVIDDSDFMTQKHKAINKMRTDKTSTAGN